MNVQDAAMERPARAKSPPLLIAFADRAASFSGALSVLGLLSIAGVICFEIFSRYVLNAPTSWVTEIATYLLVATAFLGLAAAQRAGAHIHVEMLVNRLPEARRLALRVVTNWVGFFFVVFSCWQAALFTYGEYRNDTRDWGLLSTPQWIPQLPVTVGFVLFAVSLLAENLRLRPPRAGAPAWLALGALTALPLALGMLGPYAVPIAGTRIDWGTVLICGVVLTLVFALNGWRSGLVVFGLLAALAAAFWLARGISLLALGAILATAILFFMLLGVRIALALGLVALFGLYFLLPKPQLGTLGERAWSSVNSFTLTAVPMFVLMSALLLRSGVTGRMFDSLVKWFGRTPGGLAHASVGASAIFAAVSGSSIATAATLGRVACPDMIARGYSQRLTYGVTAAGATLGIMIPPSIAMIIYGSTVGAPVNVLFIAGIVPGLALAVGFMIAAFAWSTAIPGAAPAGDRYPLAEKLQSLKNIAPFLTVIVAVLGSLYAGIATPTEAAAVGAVMGLVLCVAFGKFSWRTLYEAALETVTVTSFIMLIVVCAASLSFVFDYLRLPRTLVETIRNAGVEPWLVITLISLAYIVLGMFVESISMILMTLPVAFPVVTALGLDPIWFGIYLVTMVELGLITPPVGMVLFVLHGVSVDVSLQEIAIGVLPFVAIILSFVALMFVFPEIVSWLPSKIT